jgi:hypothetical protein
MARSPNGTVALSAATESVSATPKTAPGPVPDPGGMAAAEGFTISCIYKVSRVCVCVCDCF